MQRDEPLDEKQTGTAGMPRRAFLKGSTLAAGTALAGELAARGEAAAAETRQIASAPKRKTFLAVGAHMDDVEIGAGGVLLQLARAGHRVVIVVVVSDFSTWLNTKGREAQTRRDLLALAEKFGFEKRFLDYPYHQIHGDDLELKRKLAEIYVELKPDAAFIHHENDLAPDHAACGRASRVAFMYSHGLSHDMTVQRCPLIYAWPPFPGTEFPAAQEPDVFYDVTNVMPDWMEMLVGTDCCLSGGTPDKVVRAEFRLLGNASPLMRLGGHGLAVLAEALIHGKRAGCRFAQAYCTVRGERRGPSLG